MKQFKSILAMLLALVMILSCAAGAFAAEKTGEDAAGAEEPAAALQQLRGYKSESFRGNNAYQYAADEIVRAIVILSGDPEADVAGAGSERAVSQRLKLMNQHESVRKAMSGIKFDLKYDFTALTNGFSCDVAYGDLDKIAALDGVEAVYIANHYALPETEKETRMASSNAFYTGVDDAYTYFGVDGTSMVIAVLDTGLNTAHEAFADADGNCASNGRLTEDDVSLATMPGKYINPKVPFSYDYADMDDDVTDYNGHGTHVSGIAAGCTYNAEEGGYTFLGAASGAQLVNMKIFYDDQPGTSSDIYFAALDDAYRLGVDVVNMSIGAQNGFTYDAELETVEFGNIYERLNNAGIVLSVAGGNEYSMAQYAPYGYVGPEYQDYGTVGSPATYEGNTSVASVENYMYPSYVLKTDAGTFGFYDASDDGLWLDAFGGKAVEFVNITSAEDATALAIGEPADFNGFDVSGKIAVVSRGEITFEEKIENAYNAGAIGCIVVNNQPGSISMAIETYEIPAVSVDQSAGEYLLNATAFQVETSTEKEYIENANASLMSDFSNWGTTPMLTLDPTITSVGGQIYSASASGDAEYEVMSGTSMATPNYAGTIALVLQYLDSLGMEKKDRADTATSLLESTAELLIDEYGAPYSPRKQGTGLANAYNALYAYEYGGYVTDPVQELGDDPARSGHYTFTAEIRNESDYDLYYIPDAYLLYDYVENFGDEEDPLMLNTLSSMILESEKVTVAYTIDGSDVSEGFDLAAGESTDITVDIQLAAETMNYFNDTFVNGNYVEGFVCFSDVELDGDDFIYYDAEYNCYKFDETGAYRIDWDDEAEAYVTVLDGGSKVYYAGDPDELILSVYDEIHATMLAYYGDWTDGDVLESTDFRDYIDAEYWVNTTVADSDGNTYADYGYTGLDLLDYYTSPNMAYTGVFVGGVPYALVWYLGDNLFSYVPFYEQHICISTDDTNADAYYANGFYLEPYQLRNCEHLIMTIKNAETGEIYFVDDTPYLPKAYYDSDYGWSAAGAFYWDGSDEAGNFVPSGTVVNVNFDAVLPYGSTEKESVWSFDVLVDNEMPTLDTVDYNAETKTLTVTATDESYLADIVVEYPSGYDYDWNEYVYDYYDIAAYSSDTAGESYTATFDLSTLTEADIAHVRVSALDYATNVALTYITLGSCGHYNSVIRDAAAAGCVTDGYTGDVYCTDCGALVMEGEVIPATGHQNTEVRDAVDPGCETDGYTGDTYCTDCGSKIAEGEVIPATGHQNTEIRDAVDPGCETDGYTGDTYCLDCGKKIAEGEAIPATGHQHTEVRDAKEAGCETAGYTGDTYCLDCGKKIAEGEETLPTGHLHTEVRNATPAGCELPGYTGDTYCTDCGALLAKGATVAALGHKFDTGVVTKQPTCTEEGTRTFTCSVCSSTYSIPIAATGHLNTELRNAAEASCETAGYTGDIVCVDCGAKLAAGEVIPATGHQHTELRDAVAVSCETAGYTGDLYCLDCGKKIAEGAEIQPTGHKYDKGVISKQPTCTEDGEKAYCCTACSDVYTTVIAAYGHSFGEWEVTTPATATMKGEETRICSRCGEAETREIKALGYSKCYVKYFKDCPEKWYHEAIDVVVHIGLMDGVSKNEFAPNDTMTRAMMVTVLYRMAGSPEVTALSSFKDVDRNAWYAEPIAWAQDTGIVLGYSTEQFGPNDPVTREQIATIMWRNEGRPDSKGANMDKFSDINKISVYAESAMKWAVGEGILNGDRGRLKPTDKATRAEFACMLMRFENGSYICETMKDWDEEEELDVEGAYKLRTINGKSVKKYLLDQLGTQRAVNDYLERYEITSYEAMFLLTLKTDEYLTASYMGDDYTGEWKRTGNVLTLEMKGEPGVENMELTCVYDDDELTVVIDGVEWILYK